MTMPCHRCGRPAQYIGTSPTGADCYQCTACDRIQFIAVTVKPLIVRKPDAHLGARE